MNEQKYLTTTKNGYKIFVDFVKSHAATHLMDDENLLGLVTEVLSASEINDETLAFEKDMGRIIGMTDLVETNDTDEIMYAKRLNREIYTRFAKHREPSPTSYLTIILKKRNEEYELWSVWVGRHVPSFPSDENETVESKEFWASHALVWGNQVIQEGTETTVQPW